LDWRESKARSFRAVVCRRGESQQQLWKHESVTVRPSESSGWPGRSLAGRSQRQQQLLSSCRRLEVRPSGSSGWPSLASGGRWSEAAAAGLVVRPSAAALPGRRGSSSAAPAAGMAVRPPVSARQYSRGLARASKAAAAGLVVRVRPSVAARLGRMGGIEGRASEEALATAGLVVCPAPPGRPGPQGPVY
jgi:hypothetical protein